MRAISRKHGTVIEQYPIIEVQIAVVSNGRGAMPSFGGERHVRRTGRDLATTFQQPAQPGNGVDRFPPT